MNSRKIRIIFKENFEFQVEFPSVEILLPHLTRKNFVEFLSQRVTEVCNIAKTAGYFLPPWTHPGKKKKPGYISQEHPHMQFMDRILQDISENLSPLCYTNNNLFYFYAWKAFAP